MSKNPLAAYRNEQIAATKVDLLEWCESQNRRAITARMGRWYFVRRIDGIERAECLDGADGENVHKMLDGKLGDFAGWSEARMAGYRQWLKGCAEAGLRRLPEAA